MSSIQVPHFLYGPTPKKGYSKRAVSPDIVPEEYERLLGCYIPFDPVCLRADDVAGREARAVVSVPELECVFFSRLYRRHKLDEKGRTGVLTHTVSLPRKALLQGLCYSEVETAMAGFEAENGVPIGDIPKLEIKWDGDDSAQEKTRGKPLIKRDSLSRLAEGYRKEANVKFVMTCRGTQPKERMTLGYSLSRLLDLELQVVPISFLTEAPLSLNNSYFNLILVSIPLFVPPRIGWRTIDSSGLRSEDGGPSDADEQKVRQAIADW